MKEQEVVSHWLKTAEDDLDAANKLFKAKKYHHCLFFAHLSLEKILKALVVKKTKKHALPIHNLKKLADDAELKLSQKKEKELREITTFNIEARYNGYKLSFYKKATKNFTQKWLKKIKEIYQWVEKMF